jgi:four helix bundle protein
MKSSKESKTYDLENRLIGFSISIIKIAEKTENSLAGRYISSQIVWSGIAPALLYGEAQSAESRNDFIHKLKLLLKELRETMIALKIIDKTGFFKETAFLHDTISECNELISIFNKSIETAKSNNQKSKLKQL